MKRRAAAAARTRFRVCIRLCVYMRAGLNDVYLLKSIFNIHLFAQITRETTKGKQKDVIKQTTILLRGFKKLNNMLKR